MKLENVTSFALAVKALFDAHKDDVVVYNPTLEDDWETDNLEAQTTAVSTMLGTGVLKALNKGDTAVRNAYMDNLTPILKDLEFKIEMCRTAGTITDSLGSFGLSAFRKAIRGKNIDAFNLAYQSTYARVNISGNKTALIAVGFTTTKITSIKSNHDGAWDMNTTKINLKLGINSLSVGNRLLVTTLLDTCQLAIDSIRAWAVSVGNTTVAKQASKEAILRGVEVKSKKPRYKNIGAGSSVVLRTDMVAKNILQLTLETDVVVEIGRTELKTDDVVGGSAMTYNAMKEFRLKSIPGTGRYIKLANRSTTKKAKVLVFEVVVKKA